MGARRTRDTQRLPAQPIPMMVPAHKSLWSLRDRELHVRTMEVPLSLNESAGSPEQTTEKSDQHHPENGALGSGGGATGRLDMDEYASGTLETTQAPSQRSAFLAGFCYYEMGRHAFFGDGAGVSVFYVRALMGTFVFSVISVSVASLFARYLTTLTFPAAQRGYVAAARNWSRGVLRSNAIAYLCFAVAQMYLGYTYYPTSCGSAFSSCAAAREYANSTDVNCADEEILAEAGCQATQYRLVPFAGGIVMIVGFITAWTVVVYRFSKTGGAMIDKYGRAHTGQLPGGIDVVASTDTNPLPSSSPTVAPTARNGSTQDNGEQHPRAEFLLSIGRTVANQALFVASFSLAAQTRLITTSDAVTLDGPFWYIVFMTISTTCCMITAAGLTNFDVLMTDMLRSGLTDKHACDRFADKMDRQVFGFCLLFAAGGVSFLAGLGLLGWGIGINDESPDGGQYSHFTSIIAGATTISAAALVIIVVKIVVVADRTRRQFVSVQGLGENVSARSATYEVFMAEISMVGEQVTLCCGYVTYNLITFRTDIINFVMSTTCRPDQQCGFVYRPDFCNATAPDSAAEDAFCNVELQSAMMPFLVVTCGSFCIGFVTVLVSMTIQVIGDYWFDSTEQRTAFAEAAAIKMIARWTLRAYQFALCLFLGVHAMYGFVKMDPMKWEPLGTSAAAFAMIVLCRVAISRAHKKAAPLDAGGGSTGAAELEMDEATLVAFNRELGSWPGRSLFFGSFAYFAVQFFYQPDHMLASPYLLSMGLSFGAGVMVVTVVANIRVYLVSLRTDASKAHFARSLSWMVKMLYIAYLGSIVAFFVGFSMIGMIKPGFGQPFDRRFAVPICTGGIIGVAFSGYLTLARRQQPAHDVFKSEVSFTRLDNLELLYEDWRDLQQKQNDVFAAQATFVAGNAFFEVLFSDSSVSSDFTIRSSWGYFISNTVATISGGIVVIWTTHLNRALADHKAYADSDRGHVFQLFLCSTFAWTLSLLSLDGTKYPEVLRGTSFYPGLWGLLWILLTLFSLRSIRNTARIIIESEGVLSGLVQVLDRTSGT